jgi:hypothetical protein
MKNCIGVICRKPNLIWMNFLSAFTQYDVFLLIDDNTENYAELYKTNFPKIQFVQISNELCQAAGFTNLNFMVHKTITAWEKALFYFSVMNANKYNKVWFLEDDVFVNREKTLLDIDSQYPKADLLTNRYDTNNIGRQKHGWKWEGISPNINLPLPHYNAMCCACRMSTKMLNAILKYATANKRLFFLEACFPTIAKSEKLIYKTPRELFFIRFNNTYLRSTTISPKNLYHPIKNVIEHKIIRNK